VVSRPAGPLPASGHGCRREDSQRPIVGRGGLAAAPGLSPAIQRRRFSSPGSHLISVPDGGAFYGGPWVVCPRFQSGRPTIVPREAGVVPKKFFRSRGRRVSPTGRGGTIWRRRWHRPSSLSTWPSFERRRGPPGLTANYDGVKKPTPLGRGRERKRGSSARANLAFRADRGLGRTRSESSPSVELHVEDQGRAHGTTPLRETPRPFALTPSGQSCRTLVRPVWQFTFFQTVGFLGPPSNVFSGPACGEAEPRAAPHLGFGDRP